MKELISQLLLLTSDGKTENESAICFTSKCVLNHSENINAIMLAIKPGICSIFAKKYNKDMVYQYLHKLKHEQEHRREMKKPMNK